VDLFVIGSSAHPTARLSDAARAPPEAPAAPPPTAAEAAALQLRFSGVAPAADLPRVLGAFAGDYTLEWRGDGEAVATFKTAALAADARTRLGAGLRGLFSVVPPPAAAAAAAPGASGAGSWRDAAPRQQSKPGRSRVQATPDDAWSEQPAPVAAGARARAPEAAGDRESNADGDASVSGPLARALGCGSGAVRTDNRWGALLEPEEGGSESDGEGGDGDAAADADAWDA
jgi:hypothetical protein